MLDTEFFPNIFITASSTTLNILEYLQTVLNS